MPTRHYRLIGEQGTASGDPWRDGIPDSIWCVTRPAEWCLGLWCRNAPGRVEVGGCLFDSGAARQTPIVRLDNVIPAGCRRSRPGVVGGGRWFQPGMPVARDRRFAWVIDRAD